MLSATALAQTEPPADTIRLHKYLFRGWRFSIDGGDTYQSAGSLGENLEPYLQSDENAMSHLNTYRSRKQLGTAIGLPGNILVGVAIVSAAFDSWTDTSYLLVGSGIVLSFTGSLLTWNANGHLEEAVEIRNREMKTTTNPLGYQLRIDSKGRGGTLSLCWSF